MSTQYQIDLFDGTINGVTHALSGTSNLSGSYVIRVPTDVRVIDPTSRADLITKKHQGLLAKYASFSNITYDDMLDASGLDLANCINTTTSNNVGNSFYSAGVLQSNAVVLSGTDPTSAILTFEVFEYLATDPKADRYIRTYSERAPSITEITAEVSFNNGVSYLSTTDGQTINIFGLSLGTDFIVRFTNVTSGGSARRLFIGSWALVY